MASYIGVLEGYRKRRRRRRRSMGSFGRHRRRKGGRRGGRAKFSRAAKACSRITRRRGGSFRACMRRKLKRGR